MTIALVASLDALAIQAQNTNERLYALVDCGAAEKLHQGLDAIAGSFAVGLLHETSDASIAHLGPWLVEHAHLTETGYAKLNRIRPVANIVTWLQSPLDIAKLAAHLRHALEVQVEDGRSALVRFYDPQVLPGYLSLLPASSKAPLLEPISTWWFEGDSALTAAHQGQSSGNGGAFKVELTESEYFALRQISLPRLLHPTLAQEIPEQFSEPLTQPQRARIWQQVLSATQLGLRKFDDLTYWCLIAFGVNENIHEDEAILQAVALALDEDKALAEATKTITAEQWNALALHKDVK